jgi:lysophospholipase L1-like esterase
MNTNPNSIKILCYGDSNTWGQTPDKTGRQLANIRWTGVLQSKLGNDYYVIEEGLPSRTTNLEYAKKPGRNGKTYLIPCVASHNPIDIVVLMLGTNDLKTIYDRSSQEIADAISELVESIKEFGRYMDGEPPKIIVVSPIHVDINAPEFKNFYSTNYDDSAGKKSEELAPLISNVANKQGCQFIDAASVAKPGIDGIHLSTNSHSPLADVIYDKIQSISF